MPFSSGVGRRAVTGSRPSGRPYRSLTGRTALSRAYREGRRRRSGAITVLSAPGAPGRPQVAVVAGRRVGTAVRRNRAKRRLRAALERVPLREGTAYVVVADREVVDAGFENVVGWLEGALADRERPKEDQR